MNKMKVLSIFGTRPEAVKMAPVIKALESIGVSEGAAGIESVVAVTGQHREMLKQVLDLFRIEPKYNLDIMQQGQDLFDVTTKVLGGLKDILREEKPDLVLVHGDTTTTFTASLAAYYLRIPVGHVEAGLRTGNKYSPFPEELNRRLTGAIADIHFAPTGRARENLLREGVDPDSVFVTGNTVIDALFDTVRMEYPADIADPLKNLELEGKRILAVTTHRRENLGDPLREVYEALKEIVESYDDVEVVFPVHLNPAVRRIVNEILGGNRKVHLLEPLDYLPFVKLMAKSHIVLTDSGGIQEEAPSLGKPVLVLRDTTERPEAVEAGTVNLIGTGREAIVRRTRELLDDPGEYDRMANAVNPYGDGKAAERIVGYILWRFGLSDTKPMEFESRVRSWI